VAGPSKGILTLLRAKIVVDKWKKDAIITYVVNKRLEVLSREVRKSNFTAFLFLSLFTIILSKGGSK
jgi:hypothetical protein